MKFKKLKYNLLVVFMVALMILAVGFSPFSQGLNPNNPDDQGPAITEPGEPDETDEPIRNDIPSIRQPKQLLAYSLAMFFNGKGYKSTVTETMTTHGVPLYGTIVQNIKMHRELSNDKYLEQLWLYESQKQGDNYYEYTYADIENDYVEAVRECIKYSYKDETFDLSSGNYKTMTVSEAFKRNPPGAFEFEMINASYNNVTGKVSDNEKYYIVTVDYKKESVSENWKQKYYESPKMVNNSIRISKDIRFIFYISTKTGKVLQYSREMEYLADVAAGPLQLKNTLFSSSMNEVFEKMDESFEIIKPVSNI